MFVSTRIAARVALLVASTGAALALAQQPAPVAADPARPAASAAAPADPMAYRSVFEGYKGLTEQPLEPWRESNDTVGRIGGWQAYAREGQGGPVAGSAPAAPAGKPASPVEHGGMKMTSPAGGAATPKTPAGAASAAMPAGHTGHTKP